LNRELCDLFNLDAEALIACKQCLVKLCDSHSKNHIIPKLTKNHELIPLDQIVSDTVFAVDASHLFTKYSQPCNLHNLIADKFCEECLELCCSDCTYIPKHTNHKMKINLLKELQPAMINEFKEQFIPQTKITLDKQREAGVQIEDTNGLKANQTKVKTSIKIAEETIESVEQSIS
jgi:hypothetical protein